MIFSINQLFSDQQLITGSSASTNHIDSGAAGTPHGAVAPMNRDIGKGNPICFLAQVTADFDALTTLQIDVETDSDDGFGTAVALSSQVISLADLVAGKQISVEVLPKDVQRYIRLNYTVVGSNPTVGAITAGITLGNQTNVTG